MACVRRCVGATSVAAAALLLVLVASLSLDSCHGKVYFEETFGDSSWESRWVKSSKASGEFEWAAGPFYGDAEEDRGLRTARDASFYAASAPFSETFTNDGDRDLVVQFQVRFPQKIDCGGGYIKILPAGTDQLNFEGSTPYNVMFGPDICGSATRRVHAIFNYKGDNKLIKKDVRCETDQVSHLYTLVVHPDNTYAIQIDQNEVQSGSLLDDWDFLPPKKIKDPSASKPADWVDDAKIPDPEDHKPADWDSIPAQIADPEAQRPDDWDDELDGEWEAPMIDNPDYKGEWQPRMIDNPDYKGPWVHPEIDNPDYVHDDTVHVQRDMAFVGIDLWQVKSGTVIDNIIVTDDLSEAQAFAERTFLKNRDAEKKMFDEQQAAQKQKEEEERKKREEEAAAAAAASGSSSDDDESDDLAQFDDDDSNVEDRAQRLNEEASDLHDEL